MSRRKVLGAGMGIAVGAGLARGGWAGDVPGTAPGRSAIRVGIFLSTFAGPFEKKLDGVKAAGLDCVQLSTDCLGMAPMPDRIEGATVERIRREAGKRGVEIVSLQGTFNMGHPDAEYRAGGVRRLEVMAGAAKELGTKLIHICTGTRDRINMWRRHPNNGTPEAWRDMVGCVKDAVEAVKGSGVVLGFEPEVNNIVDSAAKARKLLDEVGSEKLKVTMDGSNLFHTGEFARMGEILDEAFELVGKDVVMAHAKDVSHDGDAGHEAAGHGKLDYSRYVRLLYRYAPGAPLLLHGLSEGQVEECVGFLRGKIAGV